MSAPRTAALVATLTVFACLAGCNLAPAELEGFACATDADCAAGTGCVDGVCTTLDLDPGDAQLDTTDASPACGTTECAPGQECCGLGTCVDVLADPANCGACGRACGPDETCGGGECLCAGAPCGAAQLCCAGDVSASCVDVSFDPRHCGVCGNACSENTFCNAGRCECEGPGGAPQTCTAEQVCCPGLGCRNLDRDARACGACGSPCRPGESCVDGQCVCGDTGVACGATDACCGSPLSCVRDDDPLCGCGGVTCRAGYGCCTDAVGDQLCVDTGNNEDHCGACGTACGAAAGCIGGDCACDAGRDDCDGSATNGCETAVDSDHRNCGACGNICPLDQTCCDGACVDRNTSVLHCGACGVACPADANSTAGCAAGVCSLTCSTGFADCDANPATGCESNLQGDPLHCGTCANACPTGANASSTCTAGVCSLVCAGGFADCDGLPGCETDINTSTAHCGGCGSACGSVNGTGTCTSGTCSLSCNAGFGNCDGVASNGCETHLLSSPAHCGACNAPCSPLTPTCSNGICL